MPNISDDIRRTCCDVAHRPQKSVLCNMFAVCICFSSIGAKFRLFSVLYRDGSSFVMDSTSQQAVLSMYCDTKVLSKNQTFCGGWNYTQTVVRHDSSPLATTNPTNIQPSTTYVQPSRLPVKLSRSGSTWAAGRLHPQVNHVTSVFRLSCCQIGSSVSHVTVMSVWGAWP